MNEVANREFVPSSEKQLPKFDISVQSISSDRHPQENQDFYFKNPTSFGVFDGIGGSDRGREAAIISANSVSGELQKLKSTSNQGEVISSLTDGFRIAQKTLLDICQKEKIDTGSTGTYGFIRQESGKYFLELGHIGDSRAYIFRDGSLFALTQDHNVIQATLGDTDQAYQIQDYLDNYDGSKPLPSNLVDFFDHRNEVTRSFGTKSSFVDVYTYEVSQGDILLFCTDGISDNLTKNEIQSIIAKNQKKGSYEISKKLVLESSIRSRKKTIRSKPDDMTALVVTINSKPEVSSNLSKTISFKTADGKTNSGWTISRQERSTGRFVLQKVDDEGVTVIVKVSPDQIVR